MANILDSILPGNPYYDTLIEFEKYARVPRFSQSTHDNYVKYCLDFTNWLADNGIIVDLGTVSWAVFRDYQDYMVNVRNMNPNYVNQNFSGIKSMVESIVERSWNAKAVPSLKHQIYNGAVPLQCEVIKILSNAPNLRVMLEIEFGAFCGLRISEITRLTWHDIRRDRGTIYVAPSKNHEDREVPLPSYMIDQLIEYCRGLYPKQQPTDFIFGGRCKDGSVTETTLENHLNEITNRLGWQDRGYTCHSLRRYFGCEYYLAHPDDLPSLAAIMGHHCLSSTTIYIRRAAAYKARLADDARLNSVIGRIQPAWKNGSR